MLIIASTSSLYREYIACLKYTVLFVIKLNKNFMLFYVIFYVQYVTLFYDLPFKSNLKRNAMEYQAIGEN